MRQAHDQFTVLFVTAVLLVGCAGEAGDSTIPSESTLGPTTTVANTTTTTGASSTVPAESTSTTSSLNDEADGSGCTPGEGSLPDGEWYGQVTSASPDEVEFDLACWFSGDAATRAAAADGEESPPPNDYYIRNVNTTLRTVEVGDDVMVVWYPEIGDPNSEATISYEEWRDAFDDRGEFALGVWLEIENGAISAIREQWVP